LIEENRKLQVKHALIDQQLWIVMALVVMMLM